MTSVVPISSTAGGIVNNVINDNPSGYADWGSFQALYEQYRVLSFRVDYYPNSRYNWGGVTVACVGTVMDRQDGTALTSYADAVQYAACRLFSMEDPWFRIIKMSGAEEADWKTTASPTAEHYLKMYGTPFGATTLFGQMLATVVIQVRGRI
jgi:hypothetical protein